MALKRGLKNVGGFSLIESMVASTVLSVGLLGLIGMFGAGYQSLHGGEKRTVAAQLARDQMEMLRAHPVVPIAPPQEDKPKGLPSMAHPEGRPLGMRRIWSVVKNPSDSHIWVVTVEVSWENLRGQNRTITLKSFRSS